MNRVRITQFNPLLLEVGELEFPEGVAVDFPPLDLKIMDLSMGGIMPGAGVIAKDAALITQYINTPGATLTISQVIEMLLRLQGDFFEAWKAASVALKEKSIL